MPSEIDLYKSNLISNLNQKFNNDKSILNKQVNNSLNSVLRSNQRQNIKLLQVNQINASYKTQLNALVDKYNNAKNQIMAFQPKKVENIKNKNALLIGINYVGEQNELKGCINDVININTIFKQQGFNKTNILTDNTAVKPTKSNILEAFKNLLTNASSGDLLCFTYSGHGTYTRDTNNDEKDGYDELIIPLDLNPIKDDELKSIINLYLKPDVTLFCLFDSCHSGTILDLKYTYLDSLNYDQYTENNKTSDTVGNVILISGCTDEQLSADAFINNTGQGAMSWSFIQSITTNPNSSWRGLIKNMRALLKTSNYTQIPQLSTGQIFDIDNKIFI
jgi:hypothetical protein